VVGTVSLIRTQSHVDAKKGRFSVKAVPSPSPSNGRGRPSKSVLGASRAEPASMAGKSACR
jgi:hypothetical protein